MCSVQKNELLNHLRSCTQNFSLYETEQEEQSGIESEAKLGLIAFYELFRNLKVNTLEYDRGRFHTAYLLQLIPIEKALKKKQYRFACHELETLIHYEPFLQPRIYYNIMELLRGNLELEG